MRTIAHDGEDLDPRSPHERTPITTVAHGLGGTLQDYRYCFNRVDRLRGRRCVRSCWRVSGMCWTTAQRVNATVFSLNSTVPIPPSDDFGPFCSRMSCVAIAASFSCTFAMRGSRT